MKRWFALFKTPPLLLAFCLMGVACLLPSAAVAQGLVRPFPPAALRGMLEVTQPPQVLLNGQSERLAPGVRIKSTHNLIVMAGTLVGRQLLVNYVRDAQGMIHDVWILNPTEAQEKRAGLDTITNIRFDSMTPQPNADGIAPVDVVPPPN